MRDIEEYIITLFDEKGYDLNEDILDGVFGLNVYAVAEYVATVARRGEQEEIQTMFTRIDFQNGDVFDYLEHLAEGMVKAQGYEDFL
tara:strand:- start:259 stop:519 length:261 start_codon:yes stop_codon:yes gene_type:complete